ncbi:tetratricopeptide repeat protein 23 isoform X1 [Paramormyrops kingsleyae]|uniref:tetratricopeptide repeat protein 23 isoform X1 n=1 Tax=Paramormyrops kingsleyae TaxID=1676925 RepID=UPI003B96F348
MNADVGSTKYFDSVSFECAIPSSGCGRSYNAGSECPTLWCEKGQGAQSPSRGAESIADIRIGPEEKLSQWQTEVQALEDSQQIDACVQAQVRCVALARLVYGDIHLKLAQAHARLAQCYLQLKGLPLQAQEHAAKAQAIIPFCSPEAAGEEKAEVQECYFTVYYTQGKSALLLGKLEEAEVNLEKADLVFGELQQVEGNRKQTEFDIATTLSRLYRHQGCPGKALCQCERALKLHEGPHAACAVYKDMATIEEEQGQPNAAVQYLLKAYSLVQEVTPGGLEEADICYSLAVAYSKSQDPKYLDRAASFFQQSLSIYSRCLRPGDPLTLSVQDKYCRVLLLSGQQERAMKILKESVSLKKSTFGDLSAEVADSLQLIGGVQMTQGEMMQAYRTMSKCLEVQNLLYGPQHKKTRVIQQTVDLLSKAPEVAGRHQKADRMKQRPPFCAVVPSHLPAGAALSPSDSEHLKKNI